MSFRFIYISKSNNPLANDKDLCHAEHTRSSALFILAEKGSKIR